MKGEQGIAGHALPMWPLRPGGRRAQRNRNATKRKWNRERDEARDAVLKLRLQRASQDKYLWELETALKKACQHLTTQRQ